MKRIDRRDLDRLSAAAREAPRRRKNLNLHAELEDPVQRLCNALEPGTYVRPHRHTGADRWELFVALRGAAAILGFDDTGCIIERVELAAGGPVFGAEIAEASWHSLAALVPGTVLFEIKRGPYTALTDKDFAAWAPSEGAREAAAWADWFARARIGDRPPPEPGTPV